MQRVIASCTGLNAGSYGLNAALTRAVLLKLFFNRYSPFSKALSTLLTKIIFNAMRFVNTDHQIRTTAVNR